MDKCDEYMIPLEVMYDFIAHTYDDLTLDDFMENKYFVKIIHKKEGLRFMLFKQSRDN